VPVRKEVIRLETDPPPEGEVESVEELSDSSADFGDDPRAEQATAKDAGDEPRS